jgi:hypothetical protein
MSPPGDDDSEITGWLVGWYIDDDVVLCIDCGSWPEADVPRVAIFAYDPELKYYQCDGCEKTLDLVEPQVL